MKKIIFLIILLLVVGYGWFGVFKPQTHRLIEKVELNADSYIAIIKNKITLFRNLFDNVSDKYLDEIVSNLNLQSKDKVIEWLKANNVSTSTIESIENKTLDYKQLLINNPALIEGFKNFQGNK